MAARHAAIGLLLAAAATLASAQATPVGLWKTIDDSTGAAKSLVRISQAEQVLTGRVESVLDPAKKDATCEACTDERKGQPIQGLTIVRNVRQNADDPQRWDGGDILDPANGKTYRVRLSPVEGGRKLEVRGYIGTPMLGRTQTWIRVE